MKSSEKQRSLLRWIVGIVLLANAVILLLIFTPGRKSQPASGEGDEFTRLTNVGKNYYDQGDAAKAVPLFEKALALKPASVEARLNLANACLLANRPGEALQQAQEALQFNPNSGAAFYIAGVAQLRLGNAEEAVKALQQAKDIDRTINAVSYQLGRAYQQFGKYEEAMNEFKEVIEFEPEHPAAHYSLSQVLVRLGQTDEANAQLAIHQKLHADKPVAADPSVFERCQYTQVQLPFKLEQPVENGIAVKLSDDTAQLFGSAAANYRGPISVLDLQNNAHYSLLLRDGENLRLLTFTNGSFVPVGNPQSALPGITYSRSLVGDLNNDRVEEVMLLGEKASQVLKFSTNGAISDISRFCRATAIQASDGILTDFDFTGKLDLLAITPETNGLRVYRNLGQPYFLDNTSNTPSILPLSGVRQLAVEDWNGDHLQDVFVARDGQPPLLLTRERGGPLSATNSPADWPVGSAIAVADLNNDLRPDLVVAASNAVVGVFNGLTNRFTLPVTGSPVEHLKLIDYDNDGWLDIFATGGGMAHVWRNAGESGFTDATAVLGLERLLKGNVRTVAFADLDQDGDTDFLLTLEDGSLQFLRNNGGNANNQIKLNLVGTKSNASGLGIRVEVRAGGLRLGRRVTELPVEIGVARHRQIESIVQDWFHLSLNMADVKVDSRTPITLLELQIEPGSCPFLYAWDGTRFRFVTDLLGAAPAGLRLSETRFVEANPEEYVWIGNESSFPPRDGKYALQITEELREALYLDEAKLVVVDHPPGTEVHTTGRMFPSKPFPPAEIITVHRPRPLRQAVNDAGQDVTGPLRAVDQKMVSPTTLRASQLHGLAEPHSLTLDFGPLPVERPLVLVMTGWLQFGGGMANVGASHNPDLPFPFPRLEVETDHWQPVDVVVGAPAGKTKTMAVDLTGKLPAGSGRLRLSSAFEIHWDRIVLFEKRDNSETRISVVAPEETDLHWRGFSEYQDLPAYLPLSPDYGRVSQTGKWRIQPAGWCTRYGPVGELIDASDNALALLNSGDELSLQFNAAQLPAKPADRVRDFFLYSVGWDKDSDFHCELGWQVEPIPWHGMDDQLYGRQPRPAFANDSWMEKYNTRWVGPRALSRAEPAGR